MPVYKLTDGRKGWYFQGYFNKKKYKKESFKTKAEAERAEREFLNKKEATTITVDHIPFYALIDDFLNHIKSTVQITTFKNYKSYVKTYIKTFFENIDLVKVQVSDFMNWYDYVNNFKIQAEYKNKIIGLMRKILFYARKKYRLSDEFELSLSDRIIDNEPKKKNQTVIYDEDMFNNFLSNIKEGSFYWVYFQVMYYTGMRIAEASALTWNDYDGEKLSVTKQVVTVEGQDIVKSLKTKNSYREIYLDNITASILNDWKASIANNKKLKNEWYIFGDEKQDYKEIIPHQKIRRICKEYSALAELPLIKIHGLRHSHNTNIYNAGIDPHTAADRLGNTPAVMLNIYTHASNEKRKNVANLLRKNS